MHPEGIVRLLNVLTKDSYAHIVLDKSISDSFTKCAIPTLSLARPPLKNTVGLLCVYEYSLSFYLYSVTRLMLEGKFIGLIRAQKSCPELLRNVF
jgi:hypothetical protein